MLIIDYLIDIISQVLNSRSKTFLKEIHQFSHSKNGRGSKTMFSISDRLAKFFGISGEHNCKIKKLFVTKMYKQPRDFYFENHATLSI